MTIQPGNGYTIELTQVAEQGMNWIVKLSRSRFGFRRILSTDWFLIEDQAVSYARQLADDIRNGSDKDVISRKPGLTLHRAP